MLGLYKDSNNNLNILEVSRLNNSERSSDYNQEYPMSKKSKFRELVKQMDFIGHEPVFNLDKKPRNQTLIGGLLCLFIIGLLVLSAFYFGQALVFKNIPTTIQSNELIEKEDSVQISKEEFTFFISLETFENHTKLDINQYLNLEVSLCYHHPDKSELTIPINVRDCENKDFEFDKKERNNQLFDYGLLNKTNLKCLDIENQLYIKGYPEINDYSFIHILAKQKTNLTEKQIGTINSAYLVLSLLDTQFNLRKFKKIGVTTINPQRFLLNIKQQILARFHVQIVKYITDVGWMFEIFKESVFHTTYLDSKHMGIPSEEQIKNNDVVLFRARFFLDLNKSVYYRKYYKIQNWLSELGGILRAMTFIGYLLNYFNDQSSYLENMINNLFYVDDLIKYFQYHPEPNSKIGGTNLKARDSIVLCSLKREKNYFAKEIEHLKNDLGDVAVNNYINKKGRSPSRQTQKQTNSNHKNDKFEKNNIVSANNSEVKIVLESQDNNINQIVSEKKSESEINSSSEESDNRSIYLESLKKNKEVKKHFYKVKQSRFLLKPLDVIEYCFFQKKESPKYVAYIGGRSLIEERSDLIYILRQNLQFDRFKNLILNDYQVLSLNSLTKFMLNPERVNLCTFDRCSFNKFIDCYERVFKGDSIIDTKLSKWIEQKFKLDKL